jgi:GH35 family endo-1,4-beta-xylanase
MLKSTTEHFKIGANLASCYAQKDSKAKALLLENFQAITPDRNFSVKRLYRDSDSPAFEFTDWIVQEFGNTDLEIHGHCLLHGSFGMSRWYSLTALEIESKVKSAIQSICDRYRGFVHEWEFLGEILSPLGGLSNTWLKKEIGPSFPFKVFKWIREVDPEVPLYYTEYGLESRDKLDACLRFCQGLLEEGYDLTGVSVQYHHNSRVALHTHLLKEAFRQFHRLGLKTKLGELTVWRDLTKLGNLAEAIQSHCYSSVFTMAITEGCESLTFWSPFDRYAWKYPEKNPGLWDFDFNETRSLVELRKTVQKQN